MSADASTGRGNPGGPDHLIYPTHPSDPQTATNPNDPRDPNDPNGPYGPSGPYGTGDPSNPSDPSGPSGPYGTGGASNPSGPYGTGGGPYGSYGTGGPYGPYGPGGTSGPYGPGGAGGTGGPYGPNPPYGAAGASSAGAGSTGGRWAARRKAAAVGAAVLIALAAGGAGAAGVAALIDGDAASSGSSGAAPISQPGNTAQIAKAVQPSVVSIQAASGSGQESGGSGVIVGSDGVILTNAHVVDGADQVQVKFSDGKTASARVLEADSAKDIAVIKASGVSGLKPAALGDGGGLAVGDSVLAVGSPLGLDSSVTSGIVSAKGRTITEGDRGPDNGAPPGLGRQTALRESVTIKNAIQTDAAINPGNSGGALVDGNGRVIGITTAIATTGGGGNIGVGFAIPIDEAKRVAGDLI